MYCWVRPGTLLLTGGRAVRQGEMFSADDIDPDQLIVFRRRGWAVRVDSDPEIEIEELNVKREKPKRGRPRKKRAGKN